MHRFVRQFVAAISFVIAINTASYICIVLIAKLLIIINLLSDTNGCRIYILIRDVDPHNYVWNMSYYPVIIENCIS